MFKLVQKKYLIKYPNLYYSTKFNALLLIQSIESYHIIALVHWIILSLRIFTHLLIFFLNIMYFKLLASTCSPNLLLPEYLIP